VDGEVVHSKTVPSSDGHLDSPSSVEQNSHSPIDDMGSGSMLREIMRRPTFAAANSALPGLPRGLSNAPVRYRAVGASELGSAPHKEATARVIPAGRVQTCRPDTCGSRCRPKYIAYTCRP